MSIAAYYTEELPQFGLVLELSIIPINRGFQATIDYSVDVFAVAGGYRQLLVDGVDMLPPDVVRAAKFKLWEQILP